MASALETTLLYSLVPVVATVLGAAAGAYAPAVARYRSYVLHLAAGVVFAVVATQLLPEIQRRALVLDVVLGFALGIVTMLAVDKLVDRIRGGDEDDSEDDSAAKPSLMAPPSIRRGSATGLAVAVGVDFLLDGLLLGVGFAAGARIGVLLALAEAVEQLSVGVALANELKLAGATPLRALVISGALGLLVFVSAVAGATVLRGLTGAAMEAILSFGLAALLYLVTEELLREAHEERETPVATGMFFAGFLAFLVIGMTLD